MTAALPLPYPFELLFMQRALLAGVVVGIFAPMIGTFVVQRRMSLIGDGIGHIAFAGVGAGLLFVGAAAAVWAALLFAMVGALGIEWLRARRKTSGDLALAIFFYSGIALGVVFASRAQALGANILSFLFGAPLTASDHDVRVIVGLGILIVIVMLGLRRVLFAVVTDQDWSRVSGLPVGLVNSVLAVLIACSVVAAMRIVGLLLVAAMMVLPVASAQLMARSFAGTMRLSVAVSVACVILGLAASRIWDLAPGGTIVLIAAALFALTASITRRTGGRASVAGDVSV